MLTKASQRLVSVFVLLAIPGIFLGNPVLITMSLVPVFVLVLGLTSRIPRKIEVNRKIPKSEFFVGETLEIKVDIETGEGSGPLIIADSIPEEFELVEGSNFKVISESESEKEISYKVKCTKRGNYEIGPLRAEGRHILNLKQVPAGEAEGEEELRVKPRLLDPRKMRGKESSASIPLPSGAVSEFGVSTMNFKELREYSPGDSFKRINWKATARNSTNKFWTPVVNEYEKEGKKQVWIYLDRSKSMELGLTTANVFENALEAAHTLSHYYISEGCMVGFSPYNPRTSIIRPDTGKKQYLKILRWLMELDTRGKVRRVQGEGSGSEKFSEPGLMEQPGRGFRSDKEGLSSSVSANRPYVRGASPFSVILTRVTRDNREILSKGLKEIAKGVQSKRGEKLPVMLVNIIGYGLSSSSEEEEMAGELLSMEESLTSKNLRKNTIWIDWDASSELFTNALLRGVKDR